MKNNDKLAFGAAIGVIIYRAVEDLITGKTITEKVISVITALILIFVINYFYKKRKNNKSLN